MKTNKVVVKRIKESITQVEYKKLQNTIRGDETIRPNTKTNLLRAFTILYFTGLRLNEVQQLELKNIQELLTVGTTKLILTKTKSERKLFAGVEFQKQLKKLFILDLSEKLQSKVIRKGSNPKEGINHLVFIAQVNQKMKEILGSGYTSHSFR